MLDPLDRPALLVLTALAACKDSKASKVCPVLLVSAAQPVQHQRFPVQQAQPGLQAHPDPRVQTHSFPALRVYKDIQARRERRDLPGLRDRQVQLQLSKGRLVLPDLKAQPGLPAPKELKVIQVMLVLQVLKELLVSLAQKAIQAILGMLGLRDLLGRPEPQGA